MDSLAALVESSRQSPNKLYGEAFLYFQALFHPSKSDMSKIQLPSYLPESVYSDRQILGTVITAALMAMLDHRAKTGGGSLAVAEIPMYTNLIMPPDLQEQLDDIILAQAAIVGVDIFASDVALSRSLEWQRHDYAKLKRCLRALDKAARVHQRITPTPLTDPFRREVKERAVIELRPVLKRLQEEFKARRRQPSADEILKSFEREGSNPQFSFLSNAHNMGLWLEFLRIDPLSLLSSSAADLFNNFQAFVSSHAPDYARRKVSSQT